MDVRLGKAAVTFKRRSRAAQDDSVSAKRELGYRSVVPEELLRRNIMPRTAMTRLGLDTKPLVHATRM